MKATLTPAEETLLENIFGKNWKEWTPENRKLENNCNPTCIFSGEKDNLIMKAHRNEQGDMVGWIFMAERFDNVSDGYSLKLIHNASVPKSYKKPIVQYAKSRIDNNPHG